MNFIEQIYHERIKQRKPFFNLKMACVLLLFSSLDMKAQLEQTALSKIKELQTLMTQAENKGIDVTKEKMTIRTAQVFLNYANWDQDNMSINTDQFALVTAYKKNAAQMAQDLPDFERNDIIKMLDDSKAYLSRLIAGDIKRKPTPSIDWAAVNINGNKVVYQGKPVFLSDFSWKPEIGTLTDYFGNLDGFFLSPVHVSNAMGTIKTSVISDLQGKPSGRFGSVFLNHKNVPDWAETKYGPGFKMREGTFTAYDIDNPGAREMQGYLLGATVPKMAGKKYTELGYLLCNEPHFFTTEGVWATGPVSTYTIEKFKIWLKDKHNTIAALNAVWGTSFTSFDTVTITIPIAANLLGTPKWYDWVTFNSDRVTDWYTFLKTEIKKYDSNAKVHLKIMPNLWTENNRNHGIDLEKLTNLSEIIGNDAGAIDSHMWGAKQEWEDHFGFEWRELCMGYDFMTSVSPDKIIYNSETHFLSTASFRDLYLKPDYARSVYWLGFLQGLNVSQTWYWSRREDGSMRNLGDKGYAGSNNQQARIINEVTSTVMDLNTFSEEIDALQHLKKPIRIFYSETSATNKTSHMDDIFHLYQALYFNGLPIGFATENILSTQSKANWDVVLVYKTPFVTDKEFAALQAYLNAGGTVIADTESLQKNEYNQLRSATLSAGSGSLISLSNYDAMASKAIEVVTSKNHASRFDLVETNALNVKGCMWKATTLPDGRNIISIVNIGKGTATIALSFDGKTTTPFTNLLTNEVVPATFTMNSETVLLLEAGSALKVHDFNTKEETLHVFPNPTTGSVTIDVDTNKTQVEVKLYNSNSQLVMSKMAVVHNNQIQLHLESVPAGVYVAKVALEKKYAIKIIKK
ncbi:T9SS type A sorting domain-containing protein [Flavobacterium algicola]|uniref:T9SS type A sorting domain-containing protein n=1 Tax=Flavobacterium algicola TaxID=556529 RepID=UPI001EFC8820|nr:T9SS type A sorting domain-containing protein [Flavobacterium algicola]MCG9793703.1 T9SS type A sorting domain-containing protein [Flavobacterium algicola]